MTGDNVPFALPQANLMSTLTAGIMSGQLPWAMIITGAVVHGSCFILFKPSYNDSCYRILLTNIYNFYNINRCINTSIYRKSF